MKAVMDAFEYHTEDRNSPAFMASKVKKDEVVRCVCVREIGKEDDSENIQEIDEAGEVMAPQVYDDAGEVVAPPAQNDIEDEEGPQIVDQLLALNVDANENNFHYHVAVELKERTGWKFAANVLRHGLTGARMNVHVSPHKALWSMVRYLTHATEHKPEEMIDDLKSVAFKGFVNTSEILDRSHEKFNSKKLVDRYQEAERLNKKRKVDSFCFAAIYSEKLRSMVYDSQLLRMKDTKIVRNWSIEQAEDIQRFIFDKSKEELESLLDRAEDHYRLVNKMEEVNCWSVIKAAVKHVHCGGDCQWSQRIKDTERLNPHIDWKVGRISMGLDGG